MNLLKNICLYIVTGFLITLGAYALESDFLFLYLKENLIGLLLTLLAINTATLGLIASKMQDIVVQYPTFNFKNTIAQMRLSLKEQIFLTGISIISLLLADSKVLIFNQKELFFNTVIVSILIHSIHLLWDTGNGVFVVIEKLQLMSQRQEQMRNNTPTTNQTQQTNGNQTNPSGTN